MVGEAFKGDEANMFVFWGGDGDVYMKATL
jgi:hypothetical protein